MKKLEVKNLRRRLVLLDCTALVVAWMPLQIWKLTVGMEGWKWLLTELVLVVSGLALFRWQGLYLARVASSRTEEIRRVVLVSIILGGGQAALLAIMSVEIETRWLAAGPILLVLMLVWLRGGYRAWLSAQRASGKQLRDVLVIGVNGDAADLVAMLGEHPEAGFRVCGVVGDPATAGVHGLTSMHLGTTDQTLEVLRANNILGVIAVVGAVTSRELSTLMAVLEAQGIHIQISNGLHGLSHRRLRATPVAYQSLYYLEPADNSSPQSITKRCVDLTIATVVLVVTAPFMALIALGIKLTDRGPVFFRQTRVGRDGQLFVVLKFRSMVIDAESRLADLRSGNERGGPLFKLERDPRVTGVGRFIRATSFDELPQLFNVLRGEMSVVGPRPALPAEVAQFDERLLDRLHMRPGMTGLWQVEARDNPHFGAYRRLDLFYVDNWSLNLDLVILIATFEQVVSRAFRNMFGLRQPTAPVTTLHTAPSVPATSSIIARDDDDDDSGEIVRSA
jgi:exopolysaccharide biosynthesis polyprenyl glycosylphosphotransferase